MSYLFRIAQRPGADDQLLGYEWIEVLAIEPWALAHRTREWGDWCANPIRVQYICLTPDGLVRIGSDDFWTAVEEHREYDDESATAGDSSLTVTTGDRSVVQMGSTTYGSVGTHGDTHSVGRDVIHSSLEVSNGFQNLIDDASDVGALIAELAVLRRSLRSETPSAQDDILVAAIAEAEVAAEQNDADGVARNLKRAGRTALATARDIGVEVAAAAISRSMGM
jgi:hypothetical protein